MNPAAEKLKNYLIELEAVNGFESIEAKAVHVGVVNQVKSAIGQLELCDKFGINAGSLVSVLPQTEHPNFCYLVVHENESSNHKNWEEVIFDGQQIQFSGGDLVIRK